MKRIYKGQSKLRLILNTKCNLTDFEEAYICYRKPDGITGFFPAIVSDVENGIIFFDITEANEMDQKGFWFFWPKVIFSDDRETYGRAEKVFVYEAGE